MLIIIRAYIARIRPSDLLRITINFWNYEPFYTFSYDSLDGGSPHHKAFWGRVKV